MAIYIDSAIEQEVAFAKRLGWVHGVTTNPSLLAQADGSAEEILKTLASFDFAEVYYQPTALELTEMLVEIERAQKILKDQLVIKIPPTDAGFQLLSHISTQHPCCVTALYSPTQALVAKEAGAYSVVVYVNRSKKFLGQDTDLIKDFAKVLQGSQTKILAASLKSTEQVAEALKSGAHDITVPVSLLKQLTHHELSEEAMLQFTIEGKGLGQQAKKIAS